MAASVNTTEAGMWRSELKKMRDCAARRSATGDPFCTELAYHRNGSRYGGESRPEV
jgi:hypothetical protein